VKLEVNGKEVSGGTKCNPAKAISASSRRRTLNFRNLRIKELPSTNPPASEIAEEYQGFQSLYSGLDLRGWKTETGDQDHWKPSDWVLDGTGATGLPFHGEEPRQLHPGVRLEELEGRQPGHPARETSTIKLSAEVPAGQWDRIIVSVQGDQRSVTRTAKRRPRPWPALAPLRSPSMASARRSSWRTSSSAN